jgi:hypothetical protein
MYSAENFRFRFNPLRDFVYCSQFLQAEAMRYAYNHWRREFRGEREENCSGILVWWVFLSLLTLPVLPFLSFLFPFVFGEGEREVIRC